MLKFQLAGGSIVGRDHVEIPRNNQDAFKFVIEDDLIVAIVCDGCGDTVDTVASEFGSIWGVNQMSTSILKHAKQKSFHKSGLRLESIQNPNFWENIRQDVLAQMRVMANEMGDHFWTVIQSYFLFTTIGALITPTWSCFFSIGDGVIGINGEIIKIGPFPNNEPPYLAFGLSPSGSRNPLFQFDLQSIIETDLIQSFLLGCDGDIQLMDVANEKMPDGSEIGPISQFWEDDMYFANSDAIRRKLKLINTEKIKIIRDKEGRIIDVIKRKSILKDDTTLIVGRRY